MARDSVARTVATVGLLLAVLLAGCGGLTGAPGSAGDTRTLTPPPVPTTEDTLPPGVSERGVVVSTLTAAHAGRLRTTNYTYVSRQRVLGDGKVLRRTNRTRRVAADGRVYAGRFDRTVYDFPLGAVPATMTYWTNGTVYATQRFVDGSPEFYGWSRAGRQPDEDLDGSAVLERVLRAVEVSVVDRESGVVLVGSQLRRPAALPNPPYLTDPHNVSLTAAVSDDSVVTRWRLAYDATVEDESVRVVLVTRIEAVGDTAVARPGWVDTAREWKRVRSLNLSE